ncbi:restriction endonuclease subunit S [Arcobacter cryaerophilus gv. pseudocryaerophilus]
MSELYSLPNGWEWKTLDEIGKLFSGSSAPQKDEYFIDGKYPFIRTKDLSTYGRTDNLIEVNDYINDKCINDSSLILAKKGTVLFPKSGASIGTNNRAKIGINAYIVSHLGAFYSKEEVINKYVYNYFLTIDLLDYCENPSYPSLKISRVKEIEIPLPPLEEQKRIVAKLDILFAKIDKAIALHQKNIDEADIFMASVLNDVFVELEEKYGLDNIGNMIDILTDYHSNGAYKDLKANVELLDEEDYALMIRATDLENGDYTNNVKYITESAYNFMSKSKVSWR